MKKINQNTRYKATSSTLKVFAIVMFIFFLSSLVSAELKFDNKLSYSNNDLKVEIKNTFGLGRTFGTIELKSHPTVDYIKKVNSGKQVVMWYDFNYLELYESGIGEIEFIDMRNGKNIERDYNFVYWEEESCVEKFHKNLTAYNECSGNEWLSYNSLDIPLGKKTIGIEVDVQRKDYIDVIWTISGKKISRHATFVDGDVEDYQRDNANGDSTGITMNLIANASFGYISAIGFIAGQGSDPSTFQVDINQSGSTLATGIFGGVISGSGFHFMNFTFDGNYSGVPIEEGAFTIDIHRIDGTDVLFSRRTATTFSGTLFSFTAQTVLQGDRPSMTFTELISETGQPIVSLNSPLNYTNSSTNEITFNCTASDILNLVNVSLILDNVVNETIFNLGNSSAFSTDCKSPAFGILTDCDDNMFDDDFDTYGFYNYTGTTARTETFLDEDFNTSFAGRVNITFKWGITTCASGGCQAGYRLTCLNHGTGIYDTQFTTLVNSPNQNINTTTTLTLNSACVGNNITLKHIARDVKGISAGIVEVRLFDVNISNEYNFTKNLAEGDIYWSCRGADNDSQFTTAGANLLSIDTTNPLIYFSSDTEANYSNLSRNWVYTNVTVTETNEDTITFNLYFENLTLSNSTEFRDETRSLNWTSLSDGIYYYNVTVNDTAGNSNSTETRWITLDTTIPAVIILAPPLIIDHHLTYTNISVNWSANDTNIDTCILQFDGVNRTVTCSDNQTQINITNIINRSIIFYVNDTFGHMNATSRTWDYTIFENSQTFNGETFEGVIETFTANVTLGSSYVISVVNLFYNGISTTGTFSQSGNDSILTINLTTLSVSADTNITFFWNIILSDDQSINLTAHNQTINLISLDDCSANTVVLYNYTMVDEGNQSQLSDTTMEINLNLLDVERQNYIANFTNISTGINPFEVCLNKDIGSSTYLVDSIVKYQANGYSIEYYNIVDSTLTNLTIPINITLYDLALLDATEFKITFKGEDFSFVENALIFIDRQYISENNSFKTVELPKTDSNGQTIGHFVRNDVVYNIRVVKDGEVLGNFNNIVAFCTDFTIGDCQIVLEATPSSLDTFSYDEELGIIFQSIPTYDNTTHAISFSFSTDDGTPKTVLMEVTRNDIFGNRSICNNTVTSASGTLSCTIDPRIDDTVLETSVYVNNRLTVFSDVKLESSDYGSLGFVLWFFITFIFIFITRSKTEVLIGLMVSVVGAIVLGITRGNIVGIGSAGIWVLVIVILGIWKINKENPQ